MQTTQTQDTGQAQAPDQSKADAARAAFEAWAAADPDRIARLLASPLGQTRRGGDAKAKTGKKEVRP